MSSLDLLLEKNSEYAQHFKTHSALMHLIRSHHIAEQNKREKFLDCIQIFSDYFQKTIMLRHVFCDYLKFMPVTLTHLQEEFGHNLDLMKDRNNRPAIWDAMLDTTSAWFSWKMLTLDNDEKTLLVHLVLETGANIFFAEAQHIMRPYGATHYFHSHAEVDGDHEQMGTELLKNLHPEKYERLIITQKQGWDVFNTALNRIAVLAFDHQ